MFRGDVIIGTFWLGFSNKTDTVMICCRTAVRNQLVDGLFLDTNCSIFDEV